MPVMFVISQDEAEVATTVKEKDSTYQVNGSAFTFGREDVKPLIKLLQDFVTSDTVDVFEQNAAYRLIERLTIWGNENKMDFFANSEKSVSVKEVKPVVGFRNPSEKPK